MAFMDYTKVMQSASSLTILGSGLSGLMLAYKLAKKNIPSTIVSKGPLIQTNTWKAQGGVAAVVAKSDSVEKHLKDTFTAGDGLCLPQSAENIISLGPELIEELIADGMNFDFHQHSGKVSLAQEGGHQERRILHVHDHTGRALHEFVLSKITGPFQKHCRLLDHQMITKITRTPQGFTLNALNTQNFQHMSLSSSHLVLATGGAGKAFLYTSNWKGATADGLRLAQRLGCAIVNAEMMQFHPTCLYHPQARNFLISEALRGEGAKLIDAQGKRFVFNFHPDGELAPRDVVSRAIEHQIKTTGADCVFLDISHKSAPELQKRFPSIYNKCLELGIDISQSPIPVVPAAHYFCGGVETKPDLVSTFVPGLFAIGECAYTGLHGANRLASNSLLECLATAHLCTETLSKEHLSSWAQQTLLEPAPSSPPSPEQLYILSTLWDESRRLMWNYVGIQRSLTRLKEAQNKLALIKEQALTLKLFHTPNYFELLNIIFFSEACIDSALCRTESRGCHSRLDYPNQSSPLYNVHWNTKTRATKHFFKDSLHDNKS